MKRILILLTVLGITLGSVATAEAKRNKVTRVERTVEASYAPPYISPVTGCRSLLGPFACLIVKTRETESFFTAKVTDAHGQPVYFEVMGAAYPDRAFCGETRESIRIEPGTSLEFDVGLARGFAQIKCPAASVKTVGTISVTLSDRRSHERPQPSMPRR